MRQRLVDHSEREFDDIELNDKLQVPKVNIYKRIFGVLILISLLIFGFNLNYINRKITRICNEYFYIYLKL